MYTSYVYIGCVQVVKTSTLTIRIRSDLKERMKALKEIDWRREIERFIEERVKKAELEKVLKEVRETLKDVSPSKEPAWKAIREFRDSR